MAPKKKSTKKKTTKKKTKPKKPKVVTLADLPSQCQQVVSARSKSPAAAEFNAASLSGFVAPELDLPAKIDPLAALASKPIEASQSGKFAKAAKKTSDPLGGFAPLTGNFPIPTPRPLN